MAYALTSERLIGLLATLSVDPANRHWLTPDERDGLRNLLRGLEAVASEAPKPTEPAVQRDLRGNRFDPARAARAAAEEAETIRRLNASGSSGRTPSGWSEQRKAA